MVFQSITIGSDVQEGDGKPLVGQRNRTPFAPLRLEQDEYASLEVSGSHFAPGCTLCLLFLELG